ncbi:hypothetical protein [Streptomyces sp. NPDC088847]
MPFLRTLPVLVHAVDEDGHLDERLLVRPATQAKVLNSKVGFLSCYKT